MRIEMPEERKKHDRGFRGRAVRIVEETGEPIAPVARDLWCERGHPWGTGWTRHMPSGGGSASLSKDDSDELERLHAEVAELRLERDVLKRSVVGWVRR